VRVWQAGSHLTQQRGAEVEDWSWHSTRRRVATLVRLTKPYRGRTILSIFSLLLATATALAPPYLSTDVYRYVWDGRVLGAGINPYRYIPTDPGLAQARRAGDEREMLLRVASLEGGLRLGSAVGPAVEDEQRGHRGSSGRASARAAASGFFGTARC